jgi:tRNA (Thr-GGU) A37 N-methylase
MIASILVVCAAWSGASWTALRPIGHIESVFPEKFATPRQGALVPDARATLRVALGDGLDATAALSGLDEYSHVWLVWAAHLNGHAATKAKVRAPHMRGGRAGLFATRSP